MSEDDSTPDESKLLQTSLHVKVILTCRRVFGIPKHEVVGQPLTCHLIKTAWSKKKENLGENPFDTIAIYLNFFQFY